MGFKAIIPPATLVCHLHHKALNRGDSRLIKQLQQNYNLIDYKAVAFELQFSSKHIFFLINFRIRINLYTPIMGIRTEKASKTKPILTKVISLVSLISPTPVAAIAKNVFR